MMVEVEVKAVEVRSLKDEELVERLVVVKEIVRR